MPLGGHDSLRRQNPLCAQLLSSRVFRRRGGARSCRRAEEAGAGTAGAGAAWGPGRPPARGLPGEAGCELKGRWPRGRRSGSGAAGGTLWEGTEERGRLSPQEPERQAPWNSAHRALHPRAQRRGAGAMRCSPAAALRGKAAAAPIPGAPPPRRGDAAAGWRLDASSWEQTAGAGRVSAPRPPSGGKGEHCA